MNPWPFLFAAALLVVWSFGGLLWLGWMADRSQNALWQPRWVHVIFAGPIAWLVAYLAGRH